MRKCKCCDKIIRNKCFDVIRCIYCGCEVSQISCESSYGKWYHSNCIRDFKNFYASLYRIDVEYYDKNRLPDLLRFRDHILFQMIMRKDLRLLKQQWSLLLKNKAVPLIFSPRLEMLAS